ncbi:MAG: DUF5688 family protein [Anaerovoracaceae bacterium]
MMDYEVFREVVVQRVVEMLPPLFDGAKAEIQKVWKNNVRKEAMIVRLPSGEDAVVAPVIYLEDRYGDFKVCLNLEQVLREIVSTIVSFTGKMPPGNMDLDFKEKCSQVVIDLVNAEAYSEMLQGVPHRLFHEFAVIYRIIVCREEDGLGTVRITNELMKEMDLCEADLFRLGVENTKRFFPIKMHNASDIMRMAGLPLPADANDDSVLFITCEGEINGAVNMLFSDRLNKVADRFGSPFYIVPASADEVDAIPAGTGDAGKLKSVLEKLNSERKESDSFSNHIYYYDPAAGVVEKAI